VAVAVRGDARGFAFEKLGGLSFHFWSRPAVSLSGKVCTWDWA